MILALAPGSAEARTPNTERILRNLNGSIDNVKVVEAFANGPIAEADRRTAENLLRDVDYALQRATGDFGRISPEDANDPEVLKLKQRIAVLTAYREKLAKNFEGSKANGEALTILYRAFREDIKPYSKSLAVFAEASGSATTVGITDATVLVEALAQLAKVDALCKSKYATLEPNERLTFQLAIDPVKICATAAKRLDLATAAVEAMTTRDNAMWVKMIDDARTGLATGDGFIAITGAAMEEMVFEPAKSAASRIAKYQALYAAIGQPTVPARVTAPIADAVTALWVEIDRLAPTFTFPAKVSHDAAAEAGAKKAVEGFAKGNAVLKSGMLFANWEIAKNKLDVPTERYRGGAVLVRTKTTKWCHYRTFTAHQTYVGGKLQGTMTFTFAGLRLQQCK